MRIVRSYFCACDGVYLGENVVNTEQAEGIQTVSYPGGGTACDCVDFVNWPIHGDRKSSGKPFKLRRAVAVCHTCARGRNDYWPY